MDNAPRTPAAPAAAPGPFASFVRFVVCGGGVGVLSSFAVTLLAVSMPWGLANAVITVASTVLCTELHARFTFGAGRRAGRREHWQSAGSAAAAYVVTCAAMLLLHLVQSSPSALTEQIVYLGASGLAGLGRFLVLRLFVFAAGRREDSVRGEDSGRVTAPVREYVVPVGVGVAGRHGFSGLRPSFPGVGHPAAVLTARRLCPPSAQPRPRRSRVEDRAGVVVGRQSHAHGVAGNRPRSCTAGQRHAPDRSRATTALKSRTPWVEPGSVSVSSRTRRRR